MANDYCVGVDIGGTTVKMGLFKTDGRLIDKWEIPTRHDDAGGHILEDVAAALEEKFQKEDLTKDDLVGIGLGVPGPVQPDGYVEVCVNLGWLNIYPAKVLSSLLGGGINCFVGNDANVAALGEMWMGGGKGHSSIFFLTLGTGVGGGVVIDGHLITGSHGLGGEIGHLHLREEEKETCNCGGRGCLEQVASATGIVREAKRILAASDKPSSMRAFGDKLDSRNVCDCAKEGDALAVETMNVCMRYMGWALACATQIVDPEVFVIGGGVSKAGPWLCDLIYKYYAELTPLATKKADIVLAELGNDAGIYGAARLVLSSSTQG